MTEEELEGWEKENGVPLAPLKAELLVTKNITVGRGLNAALATICGRFRRGRGLRMDSTAFWTWDRGEEDFVAFLVP